MVNNPENGNERSGKPIISRRNFIFGLAAAMVVGPKIVSEAAGAYERSEHERKRHEKNSLLANAITEAEDKRQVALVAELMKDKEVQGMIDDDKISLEDFRMFLTGKGVIFAFGRSDDAEEVLARYRTTVEDNGMNKDSVEANVKNLIEDGKKHSGTFNIEGDN